MSSFIFNLKKSLSSPFGFEKKISGSIQYISVTLKYLRILFQEGELQQNDNYQVLKYYHQRLEYHSEGLVFH